MIRFRCPQCDRPYLLPDALAHLPLMCKGCGQRLDVPDPTPDVPDLTPEPEPPPPPPPKTDRPAAAPVAAAPPPVTPPTHPPAAPPEPARDTDAAFLAAEVPPDLALTADPAPLDPPKPKPPAPPPGRAAPPPRQPATGRRLLGLVVDVAVGLILLVGGVLLGEMAAGRGTREILEGAGSSPRFPPNDLLLWLGAVVSPLLLYAVVANRGLTLGNWLRHRGAK